MKISYNSEHDSNYIEDVAPPKDWGAVDVRQSRVQHQAIGYLDEQYLRKHITTRGGGGLKTDKDSIVSAPAYTRWPPLPTSSYGEIRKAGWYVTLASLLEDAIGHAKQIGHKIHAKGLAMAAALASFMYEQRHEQRRSIQWLPHAYNISRGRYLDWHTKTLTTLKRLWPALLLLTVGLLVMLWLPISRPNSPNHRSHGSTNGQKYTGNNERPSADHFSSTTPSGANTGAQSSQPTTNSSLVNSSATGSSGQLSGTTSSSSLIGGKGGGTPTTTTTSLPTTGTTSATTSTPTVTSTSTSSTLPLYIGVQPINTQLDGKTLLDTTGTGITVN